MRTVPINSAEAVFAPFFDERLGELSPWTADAPGAIFHWTARLPSKLEGNRVVIQGRRARAELTLPEGVEARVEQLPLMDPRRRATDEQRRELIQYG